MDLVAFRRLRTAQAAEYVCLSEHTLEKLRCYGGGPTYTKAGRVVSYDTRDLDAWMAEKRRTSTSDTGRKVA